MQSYSDDFARREQARLGFEKGRLYLEDEFYGLARCQMQAVLKLRKKIKDCLKKQEKTGGQQQRL